MRASRLVAVVGGIAVVIATAVVAAVLRPGGGDSPVVHPGAAGTPDLAVLTRDVSCSPDTGRAPVTRAELEHFHAVAAFDCGQSQRAFPGEGEWTVETRRATADGIAALVSAFDRPDQPQLPAQGVCASVLISVQVTLVDQNGRALVPHTPVDGCGHPLESVRRAVDRLRWQILSSRKMTQVATPEAVAAGCLMHVKDMITIDASSRIGASRGGPVLTGQPQAPLDICIYRVEDDPTVGTFARGVKLDGTQAGMLRSALTGAGEAGTCANQPDFATITARGGGTIFLELGGCWRLERDDGGRTTLGVTSDPAIVQQLIGRS